MRENGRGESPGIELIWVDPASTLRGCRVVRNRGPGLILQGAYAGPGRPAPTVERVERCRFEGNTVGVWVRGAGPVPFVDCEVVENLGDGVRLEPFVDPTYHGTRLADVLFEGGTIARNGVDPEALAGPGYGVRRDPSAKLRVEGTTFEGNAAQDDFVGE